MLKSTRKTPTGGSAKTISAGAPARGFLPLVILLAAWQLVAPVDSPYFPPPSRWLEQLAPLVENGQLVAALGGTIPSFVLSLAAATVIGVLLGVLIGSSERAHRALNPTLEFMRAIPAAALVPLAALLLGYTLEMKFLVVVLPTIWPVLIASYAARRAASPLLRDVARTMQISRLAAFRKITLPGIALSTIAGVRVAAPLALINTLLVEIVTRIDGVGKLLAQATLHYNSALVYGLVLITGVLGFALNLIVSGGESMVRRRTGTA